MVKQTRRLALEEILNEKQIQIILKRSFGDDVACKVTDSETKPAMDGIAGFLGDHWKAVLNVDVEGETKKIHLFLKRLPVENKARSDFINVNNYFRREELMYKLFEEICDDGPNRFCTKAYVYTDSIVVMPDLTLEKYACHFYLHTLNPEQVFVATKSIAQFHAAFVNYETKKSMSLKRSYSTLQEYDHLLKEPIFCDCPWLKAAAKLSANLLKTFSGKPYRNWLDLEMKLAKKYLEACDTLKEHKNTLNVLLHRDLWVNNIMFKYENDVPTNAVLIDFQNLRYGPPAFDLMVFMYLTTDSSFRHARESDVFDYYYSVFHNNLDDSSKKRLKELAYNKDNFLQWCEKARMFGILEAIGLFPYILLDPKTAKKTFDKPETHERHFNVDRSEPVLAHAGKCEIYKQRNLDVCEEFVERYLL
ncbi:unnamed protein product [Arctia plantaginis]|uniref:CHK kinase-like domain-containing protein n=1 Tax=Arctia plantaginis TaxID=874455 RepID=A0A8S0Z5K0_ARCPL|nr:unnamed protein product [Arctia plantaginis]